MRKLYRINAGLENSHSLGIFNKQASKDFFRIEESGDYHMGAAEYWHLRAEDISGFNIPIRDVKNSPIVLQGKKIYRYPSLDLPRQKVDLLKENFDVKVTRNRDKADLCITSFKHIKSLIDISWMEVVSFREFYSICLDMKEEDLLDDLALDQLRTTLSEMDKDSVVALPKYHSYGKSDDVVEWYIRFTTICDNRKNVYKDASRSFILHAEDYPSYLGLIDPSNNTVFDTDVCNVIDEDLAVLDNSEYDTIQSMICNDGIENRTLALEMLANCNLNSSFDVVSGIFYWYYEWCKSTSNWNTANVKTLRNRLAEYQGDHPRNSVHSHDRYIMALRNSNKLTEFAINKTRESLYKNVLGNVVGKDASVFSVDFENLKLKE